jgi:hypothetical protein
VNHGTFFRHDFANSATKTYNPKQHPYQYMETDTSLITEVYNSAMGTWRESLAHRLCLPLSPPFTQAPKCGMLCDGVIYFASNPGWYTVIPVRTNSFATAPASVTDPSLHAQLCSPCEPSRHSTKNPHAAAVAINPLPL